MSEELRRNSTSQREDWEKWGLALGLKSGVAYLVMGQLLGLRDQQGAADFTLGVGEETLILLDHMLHCRGEMKKP